MTLGGLKYAGGKNALNCHHTAFVAWIREMLPIRKGYVEPFAGMLGVLLNRPKSAWELANDLNEDAINWWQVVRDRPDDLIDRLSLTPKSQVDYKQIKETDWSTQDELWRAWAYTIIMSYGFGSVSDRQKASYAVCPVDDGSFRHRKPSTWRYFLEGLTYRLLDVELSCMDAVKLLDRIARHESCVVYCDPPYKSADNSYYYHSVDYGDMTDVLLAQKGLVAVSGYNDDWDHLGWHRSEFERWSKPGEQVKEVVEVLWTNYEPQQQPNLFEGEL